MCIVLYNVTQECYDPCMTVTRTANDAQEALFWSKVDRTDDPNACWEWTEGRNSCGYGYLPGDIARRDNKGVVLAHRYAWELTHGPIPQDRFICHHCDNPACVNPAHLFCGTRSDNMRDMVAKGRYRSARRPDYVPTGDRYVSKNLGDVIEQQGRYQKWVADRIGMSESLMSKVVRGGRTLNRSDAERIATLLGVPFFVLFELHKGYDEVTDTHDAEAEKSNAAD
jgi:ribosome-binding protein aMBF1 (putative translation factor)